MRKDPASEWISVPEAARLKGVAESYVRVAIRSGRLNGAKVGRSYIVRRGEVDGWRPGLRGRRRGRLEESLKQLPTGVEQPHPLREAVRAFLDAGSADEAIRQQILQRTTPGQPSNS
jgi:excisionase family DNA binding protein